MKIYSEIKNKLIKMKYYYVANQGEYMNNYKNSIYDELIDQNQQLDYIIRLVNNLSVERLRIIFNIPETYENPILLTNLINDVFIKYKHIKVIINIVFLKSFE